MMTDMGPDDEFAEFDVSPEEIQRVLDRGEPVDFGEIFVVKWSTLPRFGATAGTGTAAKLDDLALTG